MSKKQDKKRKSTVLSWRFYAIAPLRFKMPGHGGQAVLSNIGGSSEKYNGVHAAFCTKGRHRACARCKECNRVTADCVFDKCRILGINFFKYSAALRTGTVERRLHAYYRKWFLRCRPIRVTIEEERPRRQRRAH